MSRRTKSWMSMGVLGVVLLGSSGAGWALQDPLNAQVRVVFPAEVETVGEAFAFLLTPSGYAMTTQPPASPAARAGFRAPLPVPLPHEAVLTINQALLAVTPENWAVVIDHPNKLVSLTPLTNEEE